MHEALPRQVIERKSRKSVKSARAGTASVLISSLICVSILIAFSVVSDRFIHWFVSPVLLCGTLIGIDVVDWVRGRLSTFDPVGLLGLLGFHFFFLAPLLHVYWDYWMPLSHVSSPPDMRDWLGGMAVLNFLGLLVYRRLRNPSLGSVEGRLKQPVWVIDNGRFFIVLVLGLALSLGIQLFVFSQFEGLGNYVASYEASLRSPEIRQASYQGMGILFTISESFPILAVLGFAVLVRRINLQPNWVVLILVLAAFMVLEFVFGGLRGSRSNVIWPSIWAVGIIHFWVRPVPRVLIYVGVAFIVLFMYFYGFYKGAGSEVALEALESPTAPTAAASTLEERTGRTGQTLILSDLGRSDVQAYLLYRLMGSSTFDYKYAWGRTYLGAASFLVPRSVWPERPPSKVKEGTEIQHGAGSYVPGKRQSSLVYGLAGEAMLNFGPWAVPIAFGLLGIFVRWVRRLLLTLAVFDSRLLLLPFMVVVSLTLLTSDLDNVIVVVIKHTLVPFLVVWIGSRRLVLDASHGRHFVPKDSS